MKNIVIFGASGHAKVIIDIIENEGKYKIAGILDRTNTPGDIKLGYNILGRESDLPNCIQEHALVGGVIAIGDNSIRARVAGSVSEIVPEFKFVTTVHPRAVIAGSASLGDGTVVMAGVVVNPYCLVGRHCILNTNASLDHDSVMAEFSSLGPAATTGGNVTIGAFSAIGIGATIVHGISVGKQTVIGAGATVLNNIDDNKISYGVPAKVIRDRQQGEQYL